MSSTYQVCAHNDPTRMPLGTAVLSTHATLEAALAAIDREKVEFEAAGWAERGGYLQRIVIEVDNETGTERVVDLDES